MSHDKLEFILKAAYLLNSLAIFDRERCNIIRNLRMGKRIGNEIVEKISFFTTVYSRNLLDAIQRRA